MSPRVRLSSPVAAAITTLRGAGSATSVATLALAAQRVAFPVAALFVERGKLSDAALVLAATAGASLTRTFASERIAGQVRTNVFEAFLGAAEARTAPMGEAAEIVAPRFAVCMPELVVWAQAGVVATLAGVLSAPVAIAILLRELGLALVGPMVLGATIVLAGAALVSPRVSAAWQAAWERSRSLQVRFFEMHQGLVELRAQGELPRFAAAVRSEVDRFSIEDARARRLQALATLGVAAIALVAGAIATVAFAGEAIVRGPSIARSAFLTLATLPSLVSLVSGISRLSAARSELAVVGSLPPRPVTRPRTARVDARAALRFEGVGFGYPPTGDAEARTVLSRLDLELPAASSLAVVGPNGSGKTTLLHLLVGVLVPDSGRVMLDGSPISLDDPRWHERVAFVSQRPLEIREASVLENVRIFAPAASDDEVIEALRTVGVWPALRGRAVSDIEALSIGFASLSRGEARRVTLARAFARSADLVVLDEPEANLDASARAELLDALRKLAGRARVVVAVHDRAMTAFADTTLDLGASGDGA